MSIVAVHGPNTFGSKSLVEAGPVQAVATTPSDGLVWKFQIDGTTTRAAADFDWTYTPAGGTPASPINDTYSPTITFSGAGAKTVTLTVTGAGTGANPYPPAGTYPITVTAVSGVAPLMAQQPEPEQQQLPEPEQAATTDYDPGAYTVAEVQAYVTENPDELQAVYDAEVAGRNRSTLVAWLEEQFPFDPGDYTVQEVVDYAEANPEDLEDIIAAEQAGKNRSTLISQLEAMRPA